MRPPTLEMVKLLNPLQSRNLAAQPYTAVPLRSVRQPNRGESDTNNEAEREIEGEEDGDFEPLLQSDQSDLERLRHEIEKDILAADSAYDRKSKVINKAIQDIGMGRYQWELFILCGMGWLADK